MVPKTLKRWFFLLALPLAAAALSADARTKPLYDTPLYNPETKSYFELVRVPKGYSIRGRDIPAITWANARKLARSRMYKGVHGRLAVVKSAAVNEFLRQFAPDQLAWIGLRYWCKYNKLQWSTGEFYPRTAYANWDRMWARRGGNHTSTAQPNCDLHEQYWPVHYWPMKFGFRWNANGQNKESRAIFVEYPTGKE